MSYHPNGSIASFTYGNGIVRTMTQNVRGLPQRSQDAGVLNDVYAYDGNGNPTSITDEQEHVTDRSMTYDDLDRLTSVSAPALWGTATYIYDSLDNIVTSALTAGATARSNTHNYDPTTNRLTSITSNVAAYNLGFTYDAQGNITQRGAQGFAFDQANRLKSATNKATYAYDGHGRRISVVGTDGVNRVYVYGQGGQLMYSGVSGTTGTKYIYLRTHMVAEVAPSGTQYLHTDGLGSPVARTNSARTVLSRTRYEPYGATAAGATPSIGFTGHVNEADTGLVYMQQRYYDPVAGRFLSIDPVTTDANSGGSFNRYAYVSNNPYKHIDPDGRNEEMAYGAGVAFAGLTPAQQATWASGERAATTQGSGSLQGFALGSAVKQFISAPKITASGVASIVATALVTKFSHQKSGTKGASGTLTTASGNSHHGNSTGSSASGGDPRAPMHPQTQQALDGVQNPSRSHGHCCEIDAINKALNAGEDIRGAKMGPVKLNESGRALPACSTCREVKQTLGVE